MESNITCDMLEAKGKSITETASTNTLLYDRYLPSC